MDGGARGNPGPAAAAAVVSTPDGDVLDSAHELLGVTTNNVAEYRGLLLGLDRARALGAGEVDVINDSELVAKQINGVYKVKHPDMKPLHAVLLGDKTRERTDLLDALREERLGRDARDAVRRALVETLSHGNRAELVTALDETLLGLRPRPSSALRVA